MTGVFFGFKKNLRQPDLDAEEPLHKCNFPEVLLLHSYRDHAGQAWESVFLTLKITFN